MTFKKIPISLCWFTKSWWDYLLEEPKGKTLKDKWVRFWCRARIHPAGVWWYNPNRLEPDMRCKNCGEDLG